jgi:membrane-associated phospholipid phosphatase
VAHVEALLFGGATPTAALQALRSGRAAPALDRVATAIHASYFFGFVAVGLAVWVRDREQFCAYRGVIAVTFALGLAGYVLLPTEPPWLVARDMSGPPAERVIVATTRGAPLAASVADLGRRWQHDPDALGDPNPSAAMPSVHTAITAALAFFLFRVSRAAGLVGLAYTAAMGVSLVYLGEHFVLDVLAGVVCAAVANASWRSWPRPSWRWTLRSISRPVWRRLS